MFGRMHHTEMSSLLTKLQGLGETPSPDAHTPVELTESYKHKRRALLDDSTVPIVVAYRKVYNFWRYYGDELQENHGPSTFQYDLVQKMVQLHPYIAAVMDTLVSNQQPDSASLDNLQKKIGAILQLQRMHIMQFESRQDEFNRYLTALALIHTILERRGL
jgi:hypothetical protein